MTLKQTPVRIEPVDMLTMPVKHFEKTSTMALLSPSKVSVRTDRVVPSCFRFFTFGLAGLVGFAGFSLVYAQNIAQFTTKSIANETIKTPAIVHFVEPGDTLWAVSERYYGRALQWTDISYDNKVPEPKRLQPGTVLLLRAGGLGSANSASVMAVTGDVRLLIPVINQVKPVYTPNKLMAGKPSGRINSASVPAPEMTYVAGDLVNKGEIVPVGATLKTGPDSFITLLMPNGSRATLPSNSQMKLVSFKDTKGKDAVLLDLVAGQVDARVQHSEEENAYANGNNNSNGKPSYRIRTKLATIGARGTYFRVALADALQTDTQSSSLQRTLVSVLEGTVAAHWGEDKSLSDDKNNGNQTAQPSAALLKVGQSAVLQPGTAPKQAVVQNLLPAPVFQEANAPQNQSDIAVRWLPVAGAAAYRVQLARDADFIDLIAQQDVVAQSDIQNPQPNSGEAYKTWFSKVAQGSYFVRVSAIAADGLEGLFALSGFTRLGYAVSGSVTMSANKEKLEFSWTALPNGNYWLEVADNKDFASVLLNVPNLLSNTVRVAALPPGNYFWRVRADVQEHGQTTTVVSDTIPMQVGGVR